MDGDLVSIDPNAAAQKFAFGIGSRPPAQPANNRSTFNVHTSFGNYKVDLTQGQNADFDKLVAANLIQDVPPASTSPPITSSTTSLQSLSVSSSLSTLATPQPTHTGIPSTCAGVAAAAFPMNQAKGWKATKVAGGLTQPRDLVLDNAGNLLVVQNGLGISAHRIGPDGCFETSKVIISRQNLNHGIVLSLDGKTLYASSATSVYAWTYDASTMSVSENSTTILSGMDSKGHVTRTLTIPPKHPNLLLISHGSNDNFDYGAGDIKTGRSCVKVFDTMKIPTDGYNYPVDGYQMGYGLRNGVGLAFDRDGM
jgi:glucose/arabinose dehydrogenase